MALIYICDYQGHCGYINVQDQPRIEERYHAPRDTYRFDYGDRDDSDFSYERRWCPNSTCYEYHYHY